MVPVVAVELMIVLKLEPDSSCMPGLEYDIPVELVTVLYCAPAMYMPMLEFELPIELVMLL